MAKPRLSRKQVYELIDGERDYQDKKWPQDRPKPLTPSDTLRAVKQLLRLADKEWYTSRDILINGVSVHPADLEALRKIAAICVRAMENFGAPKREIPEEVVLEKSKKS